MVTKIKFASKKLRFFLRIFRYDYGTHDIQPNQRISNLQTKKQTSV